VYHDLITQRSAYLRDLRVQQMAEFPDLPVIELDDADPEVFQAYLHCIYFGRKSLKKRVAAMVQEHPYSAEEPSDDDSCDKKSSLSNSGDEVTLEDAAKIDGQSDYEMFKHEVVDKFLIDLWLLATRLVDPKTANLAIDALAGLFENERRLSKYLVALVYHYTPKNSPLRLLVRDLHVHRMQDFWLDGTAEGTEYPYDFVGDVLRRVWPLKGKRECAHRYHGEIIPSAYHLTVDKK
jgi:hypothetical protein